MHTLFFSLLLAVFAGLPFSLPAGFEGNLRHQVPAPSRLPYTCEELLNENQDGSAEPLRMAQNEDHPAFSIELNSPERPIVVTLTVEQDGFCVDNTNRAIALRLGSAKKSEIFSLINQGPDNCEGRYVFRFGTGRSLDQALEKLRENDIIRIFIRSSAGMLWQDLSPEHSSKLKKMLECL